MTRFAVVLAALVSALLAGPAAAGCFLPHEVEDAKASVEQQLP